MSTKTFCRLRIYADDSDSIDGRPFHEWLIAEAHRRGLRGATAVRGAMGFGGHSEIHTNKLLSLSADLPVVVEIIDTREKIESFLQTASEVLHKGMATIEDVEATFFDHGGA
jgi:PII-like signaling protein